MKIPQALTNFLMMYVEGFRSMTVGRKLWIVILVKLAIIFLVFRLFLMPDQLADYDSDADRAKAVRSALTNPHNHDNQLFY